MNAGEAAFHEDADIAHLSWDFVGNDGDHDRNVDMRISGSESDSNSKAIEEVMDKRRDKIKIACCFFSFELLQTA